MGKTVFLLGAGATAGSGAKCEINRKIFEPPVDNNFFEIICQNIPDLLSEKTRPFLRTLLASFGASVDESQKLSEIRLEQVWSYVDLCFKHFLSGKYSFENEHGKCKTLIQAINQDTKDSHYYYQEYLSQPVDINRAIWLVLVLAGWELRTLTADVLGKIIVPPDNNFTKLWHTLYRKQGDDPAVTVITFNYDLAFEMTLEDSRESKGHWYYPFIFSNETRQLGVKIIKLHGSLNWRTTGPNLGNIYTDYALEPVTQRFCSSESSQAAIIPPTALKEEINFPQGQPPILQGLFNSLWKLALEELCHADKLIIIGYSFPQLDAHADWLFRTAVSARKGNMHDYKFQEVIYCYKETGKNEAMEQKVQTLLPTERFRGYYQGFDQFINEI